MKDEAGARALATAMVAIGARAGVRTEAFITDMDAPLGRAVGNALEIIECLDVLKGTGPADVTAIVTRLAARMVVLSGIEQDGEAAAARVTEALTSGRALETFARVVRCQGGDPRVVTDPALLPVSAAAHTVIATRSGYLARLRAEPIGRASHALGAGRATVTDVVDSGVGILVLARPGDEVREGQPLLELRHRDGRGLDAALAFCREAIAIADAPPPVRPKVLAEVR
jgi:thymidine phosphorylase